jgi:hypothetical protein
MEDGGLAFIFQTIYERLNQDQVHVTDILHHLLYYLGLPTTSQWD